MTKKQILIYDKDDKVVSKSRNLRGILRFASKQGVTEIVLNRLSYGKGELNIFFYGGYYSQAVFESFVVMEKWIRRPLLNDAAVHIND